MSLSNGHAKPKQTVSAPARSQKKATRTPPSTAGTSGQPKCHGCQQRITGSYLQAMDVFWHPEHFRCRACRTPLKRGRDVYKVDGHPTCDLCMQHTLPVCMGCKAPIRGPYLSLVGQAWHPHHAVCCVCQTPARPPPAPGQPETVEPTVTDVVEKEGKLYCRRHYEELFCPKCSKCQQTIAEGVFVHVGEHVRHPHCVVCCRCGVRITGKEVHLEGGELYCKKHFVQAFAKRCAHCDRPLTNRHIVTVHGEGVCLDHQDQHYACFDCGHVVPKSNAGLHFEDPRQQCAECHAVAVVTSKGALALFQQVHRFMAQHYALDLGGLEVPVRVLEWAKLQRTACKRGLHTAGEACTGLTNIARSYRSDDRGPCKQDIKWVGILRGLQAEHAAASLAHEFGHVWMTVQALPFDLPALVIEGLCELVAYLFLKGLPEPHSATVKHRLQQMLTSENEVYGGGLRRALDLYQRWTQGPDQGLSAFIRSVTRRNGFGVDAPQQAPKARNPQPASKSAPRPASGHGPSAARPRAPSSSARNRGHKGD